VVVVLWIHPEQAVTERYPRVDSKQVVSCRRETVLQGESVLGGWWVMAWVRQYSTPNVVGARKVKAFIFYTINALLYEKRSLCIFELLFGELGATYAVHRRLIGKLVSHFLLVVIELFSIGTFVLSQSTLLIDRQTDGQTNGGPGRGLAASTRLHSCSA